MQILQNQPNQNLPNEQNQLNRQNLPPPLDPPVQNMWQNPVLAEARTTRDYMREDPANLDTAVLDPAINPDHYKLKPIMFNMIDKLGEFGGGVNEDARQHMREFLEICKSFRQQGMPADVLKLRLFPYSLTGKAKSWLKNQPTGSIRSWTDLMQTSRTQ